MCVVVKLTKYNFAKEVGWTPAGGLYWIVSSSSSLIMFINFLDCMYYYDDIELHFANESFWIISMLNVLNLVIFMTDYPFNVVIWIWIWHWKKNHLRKSGKNRFPFAIFLMGKISEQKVFVIQWQIVLLWHNVTANAPTFILNGIQSFERFVNTINLLINGESVILYTMPLSL